MVKYLVKLLPKLMADVVLKAISIKHKVVNLKEHLSSVLSTFKKLYLHQYSADFIQFVSLARKLLLHFRLTIHEKGPCMLSSYCIFFDTSSSVDSRYQYIKVDTLLQLSPFTQTRKNSAFIILLRICFILASIYSIIFSFHVFNINLSLFQ